MQAARQADRRPRGRGGSACRRQAEESRAGPERPAGPDRCRSPARSPSIRRRWRRWRRSGGTSLAAAVRSWSVCRSRWQTDRAGREALLERFRRSNEEAGREMDIHRQKADELRTAVPPAEGAAGIAWSAEKLELEAPPHPAESGDAALQRGSDLLTRSVRWPGWSRRRTPPPWRRRTFWISCGRRYELSHAAQPSSQRVELESVAQGHPPHRGAEPGDQRAWALPTSAPSRSSTGSTTRYTYLSEQRDDVEKAKEELTGIIDEITRADDGASSPSSSGCINESFQADIYWSCSAAARPRWSWRTRRTSSNCGIEIRVQPPGKAAENHHTALRRREGLRGHRPVLRHSEGAAHALLCHGRDRGGAGRRQRGALRPLHAPHRRTRPSSSSSPTAAAPWRRPTCSTASPCRSRAFSRILTINLNDMAKELKIK